ncbi:anti-sigma factor family protein [Luteipulveratus flavus]|uniref:Zinc-finger domain-containing protein n=1 Tax=Luteipulveratus flavus TaxID=3031728 RepID=A0ABT6CCK4_9MICO|nr:hypothetical protein [Luteipulveratus sp. YIM 133296]MDF8265001.1 hypothetical protein [Luteipulveratus sp. YIM 133296]
MARRDHHLGEAVHDYVDGLLGVEQTLRVEQHLLVCTMCRAQVEQHRALTESLRSFRPDPRRQQDLMAGLLGLAEQQPSAEPVRAPAPPRRVPTLVTADAPPQYESVRQHPLLLALVAVAGCVGVTLVAVSLPTRVQATPTGVTSVPATVRLSNPSKAATSAVTVGRVVPVAVARAESDAQDAVRASVTHPFVHRTTVRVP